MIRLDGVHGLAEADLRKGERQHEGEGDHRCRDEEDRIDRVYVSDSSRCVNGRGQELQLDRAAHDLAGNLRHMRTCRGWQGPAQVADEPVVQDGTEQRGAKGASHGPEEGRE